MGRSPASSEILDRLPPHDLEAERGVLGSLLLAPRLLDELGSRLSAGDFYADAHGKLWAVLLALADARKPIDAVTVRGELLRRGEWEAFGGPAYFSEVAHSVPVAYNAPYYAAIVREKAVQRSVIHAATELLRDAYDEAAEPWELVDRAERALAEVRTGEHGGEAVPAMEAAARALGRIDEAFTSKTARGVLTGFPVLDEAVGGLMRGELVILAARPGVGKTSLACQIAEYVASRGGRVYLASLEMDATELSLRMIAGLASVSGTAIRTARLSADDMAALSRASNRLAQLPLWIDERPSLTVFDIRRAARRIARDGLSLVVVDYLQIVTLPESRMAKRYELIGQATKQLKQTARELNVPVLVLAQVGREQERDKGPPRLHHLRESGDIEANADAVYFLWQPEPDFFRGDKFAEERREVERLRDEGTPLVWLSAGKQRNGPVGLYRLVWMPSRTRFAQHEWGAPADGSTNMMEGF
ncbi:MAG: replicative DNA helicase [Phycisphaerae bacterium]